MELVSLLESVKEETKAAERIAEAQSKNEPLPSFCKTGLAPLDEMLGGGIDKGELMVVAGRPSMGTTSLLMQMAFHCARLGKQVLYMPLGMGRKHFTRRALSMITRMPMRKFRQGEFIDTDWKMYVSRLSEHLDWFKNVNLSDEPGVRLQALQIDAETADLVIIDPFQMLYSEAEVTQEDLQRYVKQICLRLKVPFVVGGYVNRTIERRQDKRPILTDLRDAEFDMYADKALFLYRDEYYDPSSEYRGCCEMILHKNNSGATGSCLVGFSRERFCFFELKEKA